MRRPSHAVCALAAVKTIRSPYAGTLILVSMLLLGFRPVSAKPADGSKCRSDWVYNPRAMACFTQGEDDAHNGVRHPHYVACSLAGEVFCCVDDDHGSQNCEAVKEGPRHDIDVPIAGLLQAQQTNVMMFAEISAKVDTLERRVGELNGRVRPLQSLIWLGWGLLAVAGVRWLVAKVAKR